MAIAFVQQKTIDLATGAISPLTLTYTSNNTSGNFLVFVARGSNITGITDTQGNSWNNTNANGNALWYAVNCNGGANTLTITFVTTTLQCVAAEYSGVMHSTAALDGTLPLAASASSTTATSNTLTTFGSGDLILGWGSNGTTNTPAITAGAGFTLRSPSNQNCFLEDSIQSTAGATTSTLTYGATALWSQNVAAFKPLPVAGAINYINSAPFAFAGGGTSVSVTLNMTGASALFICLNYFSSGVAPTVSDSFGNTWTVISKTAPTTTVSRIFYVLNAIAGAGQQFTISGSGNTYAAGVVMGFNETGAFDNAVTAAATAASIATGTITPAGSNELFVATAGGSAFPTSANASSYAVDSSFIVTERWGIFANNNMANCSAYLIQGVGAAVNPTFSWTGGSTDASAIIMDVKLVGSGGGGGGIGWTNRERKFINKR